MIIHIKRREHPYAQIDKRALHDPRLSWQATGLLSYLLGMPDDWRIKVKQLVKAKRNGRDAVQAYLRELVAAGYAQLVTIRGEDGKIVTRQYVISENPTHWEALSEPVPTDDVEAASDQLQPAFPAEENPSEGFPVPTNNDGTNLDLDQEQKPQDDFSSSSREEESPDEAHPPPSSCAHTWHHWGERFIVCTACNAHHPDCRCYTCAPEPPPEVAARPDDDDTRTLALLEPLHHRGNGHAAR